MLAAPEGRWGRQRENQHPRDAADFGRCAGVLRAAPELRPHLLLLANGHGPQWAALAGAWDELERLYDEEAPTGTLPRLYERMRTLLKWVE